VEDTDSVISEHSSALSIFYVDLPSCLRLE